MTIKDQQKKNELTLFSELLNTKEANRKIKRELYEFMQETNEDLEDQEENKKYMIDSDFNNSSTSSMSNESLKELIQHELKKSHNRFSINYNQI